MMPPNIACATEASTMQCPSIGRSSYDVSGTDAALAMVSLQRPPQKSEHGIVSEAVSGHSLPYPSAVSVSESESSVASSSSSSPSPETAAAAATRHFLQRSATMHFDSSGKAEEPDGTALHASASRRSIWRSSVQQPQQRHRRKRRRKRRRFKEYKAGQKLGRWTDEEHEVFLRAFREYGRDWRSVSCFLPTRTAAQVRSHAQKYLAKEESSATVERIWDDPWSVAAEVDATMQALQRRYAELHRLLMRKRVSKEGEQSGGHVAAEDRSLACGRRATGNDTLVEIERERTPVATRTTMASTTDAVVMLSPRVVPV